MLKNNGLTFPSLFRGRLKPVPKGQAFYFNGSRNKIYRPKYLRKVL